MCTYLDQVASTYYFRRAVPDELRVFLLTSSGKPRTEFKLSLGTKDREKAKRLLPDFVQMTDRLFDEARLRLASAAEAHPDTTPPIDGKWLGGFASEQAEFVARKTAEQENRRLARRPFRDEWRERLNGSTEQMEPREAALRDLVREQEERAAAAEARVRALEGTGVPNATQSHSSAPAHAATPVWLDREIVELWAAERKPRQKTVDAHRAVARWFYEMIGRKAVDQIDRENVLAFKSKLLEAGQSLANIKVKLSRLRTLLQWATDNGHATTNAAQRVTIKDTQAAKNRRKSFDLPALNAVFGSAVFVDGARPTQGKGEAAYWMPLLALFTGARLEELGQLRTCDVVQLTYPDPDGADKVHWFVNLVEVEGEDGTELKTAESERLIPVHHELIRLGFLDYAQSISSQGHDRLFHLLTPGPYKILTHKWGQWFGTYLRKTCGVTDRRMTFHSFRHTFIDYVRRPDIPEGVQRQLVGHGSKDVHDDYGSGYNLHWIVEAMKLFKAPGLKLPNPLSLAEAG